MILSGEMEAVFPDVQVGLVVIFDYVCVNMKKKYVWNKLNNQNSGKTLIFLNTLKVHKEIILKDINNNIWTSA